MNEFYFSKVSPTGEFVLHVWAGKLCFQAPSYLIPPEQVVESAYTPQRFIYLFSKKCNLNMLTHQIPNMS